MNHLIGVGAGKETRYYTALGKACDALLRCKDCQQLVLLKDIHLYGCCPCGNKKFAEVTTLKPAEHELIASGALDFPYRAEFLKEFEARG